MIKRMAIDPVSYWPGLDWPSGQRTWSLIGDHTFAIKVWLFQVEALHTLERITYTFIKQKQKFFSSIAKNFQINLQN